MLQNVRFADHGFKPVQRGFKLSINSLLSLHDSLVKNGPLEYIMSGRLTQDALENLFSQVIMGNNSEFLM